MSLCYSLRHERYERCPLRAKWAHEAKDEANQRWLDAVTEKKLNDCEDVCHPACCGGQPGVSL